MTRAPYELVAGDRIADPATPGRPSTVDHVRRHPTLPWLWQIVYRDATVRTIDAARRLDVA